jgi:arylsulfatase A-like enzyme
LGRGLTHPVRTAVAVAAVVAAGVAGSLSSAGLAPHAMAAGRHQPDVVLVITDDQRSETLQHMRSLRRQMIHRGVRFRSAFVPNPSCCPSRASFYTGDYSHTNGVWKNRGPEGGVRAFDASSTLATWLQGAGYRTGLFGKYMNGYTDASIVPPGWSEWFAFLSGDGRAYYGFNASRNGALASFSDNVYSTTETYERVSAFIRSTPQHQPLFAVWTPIAPHRPFTAEERYVDAAIDVPRWRPPNYNERDVSDKPKWVRRNGRLDAEARDAIDADRLGQYRTLLSVDDGIAQIVRELRRTGRLSNTLLVFTSDNGLMWGEHRLTRKAVPYDGASHVPLVVRYDPLTKDRRGASAASLVGNIDIAPTIMDLAGLTPPSPVDGVSLVSVLDGSRQVARAKLVIEHAQGSDAPAYCGVRTKRELFVRYTTGEEEYYRLGDDPWTLENLAARGVVRDDVRELRSYAKRKCRPLPPGFEW